VNRSSALRVSPTKKPKGCCLLVGAGKSAAAIAGAVKLAWLDVDILGVVVTRQGHSVPTSALCWTHTRRKFFELADIAGDVRKGKPAHQI